MLKAEPKYKLSACFVVEGLIKHFYHHIHRLISFALLSFIIFFPSIYLKFKLFRAIIVGVYSNVKHINRDRLFVWVRDFKEKKICVEKPKIEDGMN